MTLDGHLILVADLADAELARAFAEKIGGDLSRAVTRRGDREFVEAPAPPPFELRHRRLFVTGGAADEQIDVELTASALTVDLDGDGAVDYATKRRSVERVVVDGGGGQDRLTYTSSRTGQDFDVRRGARGRTIADGGVPVALDRVERLDLAAPGGPGNVDVGDLDWTTLEELHGAFGQTRLAGTPDRDFVDTFSFAGGPVSVIGLPVFVQIDDPGPGDALRLDGRAGDDQLSGSSLPAGGIRLTIDGGDGGDVIIGGSGDDVLLGGDEFDDVTPNKGDDLVDLGAAARSHELEARRRRRSRQRPRRPRLPVLPRQRGRRAVRALPRRPGRAPARRDVGAIQTGPRPRRGDRRRSRSAGRTRSASATSPAPGGSSFASASRPRFGSPGGDGQAVSRGGGGHRPRGCDHRGGAAAPPRVSPGCRRIHRQHQPCRGGGRHARRRHARRAPTRSTAPAWRPRRSSSPSSDRGRSRRCTRRRRPPSRVRAASRLDAELPRGTGRLAARRHAELSSTAATWWSTVRTESTSRSAICGAFVSPSQTNSRTSSWRSVSPGRMARVVARGPRPAGIPAARRRARTRAGRARGVHGVEDRRPSATVRAPATPSARAPARTIRRLRPPSAAACQSPRSPAATAPGSRRTARRRGRRARDRRASSARNGAPPGMRRRGASVIRRARRSPAARSATSIDVGQPAYATPRSSR